MFKLNNITICDCYIATTARKRKAKQVQKGYMEYFFSKKISNSLFQKPFIENCIKIPKLKVICINRERYDYNINYKGQKEFTRRHVSGHAFKPELKELIERINPGKIIAIHTTNLKQFKEMFGAKLFLPIILSQSKYSLFFKSDLSIL
jgi:mRNA degradation ribonuclease J1/J2